MSPKLLHLQILFQNVDRAVAAERHEAEQQGVLISCRDRCANCCVHRVLASDLEAEACVTAYAARFGEAALVELAARTEAQLARARSVNSSAGYARLKEACVFLSDSRCTVYEARPLVCRLHVVTGDPEKCGGSLKHVRALGMEQARNMGARGLAELGVAMVPEAWGWEQAKAVTDEGVARLHPSFQRLVLDAIAARRRT